MRRDIWDMVDVILSRLNKLEDWREEYERERELKELRLFERIVKMIDERVKEKENGYQTGNDRSY